ncbi:MAG: peptidase [Gemmatales bacterium]|nr:MAG: peptidase [Gemmatales bacterium]GIW97836.1 MAG: peptidase [Pirellulaceae bacterium]
MFVPRRHFNALRDAKSLHTAVSLLENPGLLAQFSGYVGMPIESAVARLPAWARTKVLGLTQVALGTALETAVKSNEFAPGWAKAPVVNKVLAGASGAVGGAFGLPALAIELPVSTTFILRSVATIAESEGEDLSSLEACMNCLQVFALGGRTSSDDASESAYFAVRAALAHEVTQAAQFIAKNGLGSSNAPAIVSLITELSARFSIPVTQKVAAQAVPIIGGAAGALINTAFISHFENMAKGHFTVRRLERLYGAEVVQREYRRLASRLRTA